MKKLCLFLSGVLLTSVLAAQLTPVDIPNEKGGIVKDISRIGDSAGSVFFLESIMAKQGKEDLPMDMWLLKYDNAMKLVSKKFLGRTAGDDMNFLRIMDIRGNLLVFSYALDRKGPEYRIFYQFIDPETLNPKAGNKEIPVEPVKGVMFFPNISVSNDNSKILMFFRRPPDLGNKKPEVFLVSVFDNEMNPVWNTIYTSPLTYRQFDYINSGVKNNGEVRILGEEKSGKLFSGLTETRKYAWFSFDNNGKDQNFSRFEPKLHAVSISAYFDRFTITEDLLYTAGFCELPGNVPGYFIEARKLPGLEKIKSFQAPLPIKTYDSEDTETGEKKEKDKSSGQPFSFSIRNLITDENGNAYLIGERHRTVIVNLTNTSVETNYYYDIYVCRLNADGHLAWEVQVPKKQVITPTRSKDEKELDDFYSSYCAGTWNNKLLLFINDNAENVSNIPDKVRKVDWQEAIGQAVIIGDDGRIIRKTLSDAPGFLVKTKSIDFIPDNKAMMIFSPFKKYENSSWQMIELNKLVL